MASTAGTITGRQLLRLGRKPASSNLDGPSHSTAFAPVRRATSLVTAHEVRQTAAASSRGRSTAAGQQLVASTSSQYQMSRSSVARFTTGTASNPSISRGAEVASSVQMDGTAGGWDGSELAAAAFVSVVGGLGFASAGDADKDNEHSNTPKNNGGVAAEEEPSSKSMEDARVRSHDVGVTPTHALRKEDREEDISSKSIGCDKNTAGDASANEKPPLSPSTSLSEGGDDSTLATSAVMVAEQPRVHRPYIPPNDHHFIAAATESSIVPKFQSYEVSARALKGNRVQMEDEYVINDGGRFVAVFDGHGGSGVSRYLRSTLYKRMKFFLGEEEEQAVEREVRRKFFPFLAHMGRAPVPTVEDHASALRSAFRSVDKEVMMEDRLTYQGSTAVAVILHEGENGRRTLLSANIGDSRAILSRKRRALNLTRDHKPSDEREKQRIVALGETVEFDGFVHRVRNLSLSRAIGDRFAKPVISSDVEMRKFSVRDGDDFVVLASDGLWDVMSSQEAVDYVHRKLESSNLYLRSGEQASEEWKRRHMSRFLASEALRRGSADNVCVIVVWLNEGQLN